MQEEKTQENTGLEEEIAETGIEDIEEIIASDRDESSYSTLNYKALAVSSFENAKLDKKILDNLNKIGWKTPTEVQGLCLPHTIKGQDVAGFAQTGTGKTGVFLLTAAQKLLQEKKNNDVSCIILAPTRELAIQIDEECKNLIAPLDLTSLAVYGGMDYEKQASLIKKGVDIIVATPGRLKDYAKKRVVNLKQVNLMICDEVDRMFEMGFIEDVEYFLDNVSDKAQKLFFSATTNDNVKELSFEYLNKPHYIAVSPDSITSDNIEQSAILCETTEKLKVFMGLLREHNPERAIIFANTKLTSVWLQYKLKGNGFEVDCITGDLPQRKRISLVRRIKSGQIKLLIATDVASRGLHIAGVTHVYNFDLPGDAANYVHRIGRTARAGAKGVAVSLVCEEYAQNLLGINELLGDEAPKCVWFPKHYLDLTDESGDPFEDNFGKGHSKPSDSDRRPSDRRPSERRPSDRGPRHKGRDGRGRDKDSSDRPNNRKGRDGRGNKDHKGRDHKKNRHDKNDRHRGSKHKHHHNKGKSAHQKKDEGFGSLVKKMFKAIFGKK